MRLRQKITFSNLVQEFLKVVKVFDEHDDVLVHLLADLHIGGQDLVEELSLFSPYFPQRYWELLP